MQKTSTSILTSAKNNNKTTNEGKLPSKHVIQTILNYSKSLKVEKSVLLGNVAYLQN